MGRRRAAAGAAVALAAAAGVAVLLSPPSSNAGGQKKAILAVVGDRPLTVRGARFAPNERVTLTVYPAMRSKTVVAGFRGGFTVRFTAVQDPCRPYRVVAVGARGSRAVVREIPPPCLPIEP